MTVVLAMSIREAPFHVNCLTPALPNSQLTASIAGKFSIAKYHHRTEFHTESRKLSYLFGNSCHGLLQFEALGLLNYKPTSALGLSRPSAYSRDPESEDGAVLSTSKQKRWFQRGFQKQLLHLFDDFRIGRGNFVEGCIGLVLVAGSLFMGARILWVKGSQLRSRLRKYQAVIEFPLASGVTVGTPVRVRGVEVGAVIRVRPSLERIDCSIQVMDSSVLIPRNALVEVIQSGLMSETIIDITPEHPLPHVSVGPLDPLCTAEGLIVCDKEKIEGKQGSSMDDLMRLCGKMARDTNEVDVRAILKTVDQIEVALDNIKPLLDKIETLAEDVEPVLKEMHDGRLVDDLTQIIQLSRHAAYNLRNSTMTTENSQVLHDSVATLTTTLRNAERTTSDVGALVGNDETQNNLKHLIESLSRLVND